MNQPVTSRAAFQVVSSDSPVDRNDYFHATNQDEAIAIAAEEWDVAPASLNAERAPHVDGLIGFCQKSPSKKHSMVGDHCEFCGRRVGNT